MILSLGSNILYLSDTCRTDLSRRERSFCAVDDNNCSSSSLDFEAIISDGDGHDVDVLHGMMVVVAINAVVTVVAITMVIVAKNRQS